MTHDMHAWKIQRGGKFSKVHNQPTSKLQLKLLQGAMDQTHNNSNSNRESGSSCSKNYYQVCIIYIKDTTLTTVFLNKYCMGLYNTCNVTNGRKFMYTTTMISPQLVPITTMRNFLLVSTHIVGVLVDSLLTKTVTL